MGLSLPTWTHTPLTAAIRGVMTLPMLMGLEASQALGGPVGRFMAKGAINKKRFGKTAARIHEAFPEHSREWADECAAKVWSHLVRLSVEMVYTPRLMTDDTWASQVSSGPLREGVRALLDGKPVILVTGHIGNWELAGHAMSMLGFPIHALYRPLDMVPLDRWVRETRELRGMRVVDKFGAYKQLPDMVRDGAVATFVADQNAGDRGVFVPFFGRLTSTYKSVALLAMQTEATVLVGGAIRDPYLGMPSRSGVLASQDGERHGGRNARRFDAFGHKIILEDVIQPEDWQDAPDPVYYITARYRRGLEAMVRRAPDQYFWMHRVWKSRPKHERLDREFPESLTRKLQALPWMDDDALTAIIDRSERDRVRLRDIPNKRLM